MNNVKFAVIKMNFDIGELKEGLFYNALLYGNYAAVISNALPIQIFPSQFIVIKEVSDKTDSTTKELTGLASLMGQKMKSAHFEFGE